MFGRGGKTGGARIEPRLNWRDESPGAGSISAPTPPTVRQPDAGQGTPLRGRLRAPSARAGRAVRCLAVSSTGVSFSRYGASSRSPRSSPITRANCRRSISSRCPNAPPTSPSSPMTARLSPIAATPAAPRSGSSTCRPICRRRSWRSRTGVSTSISASTRSASARALLRDVTGARRHRRRLDADPAACQKPVPDAGAHAFA